MKAIHVCVALTVVLGAACLTGGQPAESSRLEAAFSRLPLDFIENRGVYPDEVAYYVEGADKTLFFTRDGVTLRLKGKENGWVVRLEFVGANPDVIPRGEGRRPGLYSYFRGPEKDWKVGLPTFAAVGYEDLWPGIDLVYTGTVDRLKYEFVVKPGADPARIRLRYRGAAAVGVTAAGSLRVETPLESFEDARPRAYQLVDGRPVEVDMAYALDADDTARFGFRLGDYDRTRRLVLDPAVLVHSGYVGGSGVDYALGIAVDASGNAYVTGMTQSNEQTFPVKVGPDLTYNAGNAAFVAKVNLTGTGLIYCGYIDGSKSDRGNAIAVDAAGSAYVTGWAQSDEQTFPVKVGPDLTHNGGLDVFVAKVNPQGTGLDYCGYIGGSGADYAGTVAVDASGNAYVAGYTQSNEQTFPVRVGPDLTANGADDVFVAKVNPQGSALVYCGYIGGSAADRGGVVAVDGSGQAYVGGWAASNEQSFPVLVGPDLTHNGGFDAFVARVNAAGTALSYCGYIGGLNVDLTRGLAVDAAGHAYVTGETQSDQLSFPVFVGPDLTHNGGTDAFVAKVNPAGTALIYCGYVGGAATDIARGIGVDAAGSAQVAGETLSDERSFPVRVGPDLTYNGAGDAFVAKVDPGGTGLVYAGYVGGATADEAHAIAVDPLGNAFLAGETRSDQQTFPVRLGPDLTFNGGTTDGFVAKVSFTLLAAGGSPRPGGQVDFFLTSLDDRGLPYQIGTSLGTGPIPIDTRRLDLSPDTLLFVSTSDLWPWIFSGYRGVIDAKGQARAFIHLPNLPALIGLRIHSAFVTVSASAPSGIKSISNTFSFSITK